MHPDNEAKGMRDDRFLKVWMIPCQTGEVMLGTVHSIGKSDKHLPCHITTDDKVAKFTRTDHPSFCMADVKLALIDEWVADLKPAKLAYRGVFAKCEGFIVPNLAQAVFSHVIPGSAWCKGEIVEAILDAQKPALRGGIE